MSAYEDLSFVAPNTPSTPNKLVCQWVGTRITPNKTPKIPLCWPQASRPTPLTEPLKASFLLSTCQPLWRFVRSLDD
jgi:hypothetical protein